MLTGTAIRDLVPHQGAMCLLDGVDAWSADHVAAWAESHLDPTNPLRRAGRLAALCGAEYGFQAAALHGALAGDGVQPAGRVAALRLDTLAVGRLDDPRFPRLEVEAWREFADARGLIYRFAVSGGGRLLVAGSGTIILPSV